MQSVMLVKSFKKATPIVSADHDDLDDRYVLHVSDGLGDCNTHDGKLSWRQKMTFRQYDFNIFLLAETMILNPGSTILGGEETAN